MSVIVSTPYIIASGVGAPKLSFSLSTEPDSNELSNLTPAQGKEASDSISQYRDMSPAYEPMLNACYNDVKIKIPASSYSSNATTNERYYWFVIGSLNQYETMYIDKTKGTKGLSGITLTLRHGLRYPWSSYQMPSNYTNIGAISDYYLLSPQITGYSNSTTSVSACTINHTTSNTGPILWHHNFFKCGDSYSNNILPSGTQTSDLSYNFCANNIPGLRTFDYFKYKNFDATWSQEKETFFTNMFSTIDGNLISQYEDGSSYYSGVTYDRLLLISGFGKVASTSMNLNKRGSCIYLDSSLCYYYYYTSNPDNSYSGPTARIETNSSKLDSTYDGLNNPISLYGVKTGSYYSPMRISGIHYTIS